MRDGLEDFADLLAESEVDPRAASPVDSRSPQQAADPETLARRRRRRRRGWLITGIAAAVIVALVGGYAAWALTTPVALPVATTRTPVTDVPAAATLTTPDSGAWAVTVEGGEGFLPEEASGLWMSSEPDEPRAMASITKLVTALVILDRRPLDGPTDEGPTLTFHGVQKLYDKYYVQNATVARMRPGSTMSQRDVLEMMLIISASNYAEAAAVWAFGSTWSFTRAAEAWLDENGLHDTRVVEPSGIDPRNTSTPRDMIALGKIAMADPVIAEIVGMPQLEVPGFSGTNTNSLVLYDLARGIKTGTLEKSGANLLFSAWVNVGLDKPLEVTGVAMGSGSQGYNAERADALMSEIRSGFHTIHVGSEGEAVGDYETPWGATARMVMASGASLLTWSDTPIEVEMTTTDLSTGTEGEAVGSITWTAGTRSATVDLVLDRDIDPPGRWWRLTHPLELLD